MMDYRTATTMGAPIVGRILQTPSGGVLSHPPWVPPSASQPGAIRSQHVGPWLNRSARNARTRYVDNSGPAGTTLPERDDGTLDFYEQNLSGLGKC